MALDELTLGDVRKGGGGAAVVVEEFEVDVDVGRNLEVCLVNVVGVGGR